jgi:hypothetical protein
MGINEELQKNMDKCSCSCLDRGYDFSYEKEFCYNVYNQHESVELCYSAYNQCELVGLFLSFATVCTINVSHSFI